MSEPRALLALDLDGTTLGPTGVVSEANRRAIRAAREAGFAVTVCTGRGLVECSQVLESIEQRAPVVVAGGAMIADPVSSRTVHRFTMDLEFVSHAVGVLLEHGYPALVLKDPLEAGYDYLVVRGKDQHELDPVTSWWFEALRVRVRFATHLHEDSHPEHTVRFGTCGLSGKLGAIKQKLSARWPGEHPSAPVVHHFPAVVAPHHVRTLPEGEAFHVLEVFDKRATKWSAVNVLARELGVEPGRIIAIGDEINDLDLITNAGLGIAMGNAVESVKKAARRQTRSNAEDGVAYAIEQVLSGAWSLSSG
ncbi:MAG: HAD hydrolase family protein [Planctomycetota bacterium]|nr:HAD hydrolase family protein [Planctomycetota bacterium]